MHVLARPSSTVALVVAVAACFGLGATIRGDGRTVLEGVVVDVVPIATMPASVNRWCLFRSGERGALATTAAIVEFGGDARKRRYAFPQRPGDLLVPQQVVASAIESCTIDRPPARTGSSRSSASTAP